MLLGESYGGGKRVAVISRSPQFKRLLASLLVGWKYSVAGGEQASRLIFIERGLPLPATAERVVWLTPLPLPLADEESLLTPVSLTKLYLLLEDYFFPTPRRHIRIPLDLEVDLQFDGQWLSGRLVSLSDRGGRMTCPVALPTGASLFIEVRLGGRMERLPAEVIYCIPAGDTAGREQTQIGVVFKPEDVRFYGMLQRFIEKACLESACTRAGIAFNDPSVSWFDVVANPWEGLR